MNSSLNKTLIAVVVSVTLVACGGGSSNTRPTAPTPTATPAPAAKASFSRVECNTMLSSDTQQHLTSGSTCGFLTVPEKHAVNGQSASKKTIQLAVVKLAAKSADNKMADPVVYLHGGPGGTAIAEDISEVVNSALVKNRDVYMVDQRGVGLSKPALNCPNYRGQAEQLKACKKTLIDSGVDLSAYTSLQSAWDFIELRKVLNIEQWNLYGGSYGTRLATTIMRENEEGIRSVILDGMFPIEVNGISENQWAIYATLNQLLKNCAGTVGCDQAKVKTQIESIVSRLQNQGKLAESRAFISAIIEQIAESTLFDRIHAIEQNFELIEVPTLEGGIEEGFFFAQGLSVVCAEEYPFLEITAFPDKNNQGWSETMRIAVSGIDHLGFNASSCKVWDIPAASNIETKAVTSNLPVLILNGQNDAQTPPAWGELVAKNMTMSQNFTNPQGGHVQLGNNACFERLLETFLNAPTQDLDASCVSAIPATTYAVATTQPPITGSVSISKGEDFTDPRDNQVYPTVKIGDQVWMAKNLNYDLKGKSWHYNNDPKNGEVYGRLYLWEGIQGAIPAGWHIAADEEWKTLEKNLGMPEADLNKSGYNEKRGTDQGTQLQANGKSLLNIPMSGFRHEGEFLTLGERTYLWVNTQEGDQIYRRRIVNGDPTIYRFTNDASNFTNSIRLIKD